MSRIVWPLIVYLHLFVGSTIASSIDVVPRPKTVLEGDNVLIVCSVNETSQTGVFWEKNDTSSTFHRNGTLLIFIKINRLSAGEYICYSFSKTADHGSENNTDVVDVVLIDVQYPAEVTNFSVSPTTVTQDQTITMTCTVSGNPAPSYTISSGYRGRIWHNITQTSQVITNTITSAQCEDAGTWGCSARNKLNTEPSMSDGVNITVYCAPKPSQSFPDMRYHLESGLDQAAQFEMDNVGYPYPNYTWSFSEKVLPQEMHQDIGWLSVLKIPKVKIEDFGNYTLTMTNSIGSYIAVYDLLPAGPPRPPTNLTFSNVTSDGATIHWVSGFDMWKHQQFVIYRYIHGGTAFASIDFVNDTSKHHGVNEHYTYEVTGLKPGTNYTLVVASESPGYVSYTNKISFKTKGSSSPPVNSAVCLSGLSLNSMFVMVLLLILQCK